VVQLLKVNPTTHIQINGGVIMSKHELLTELQGMGFITKTAEIEKIAHVEKTAKPNIELLFKKLRTLAGSSGDELADIMGKLNPKGQQSVVKEMNSGIKKLLKEDAKSQVKKTLSTPSVAEEAFNVISKDPSKVAPGAGVGAAIGGGMGALTDTDIEETNMFGATKKRPGGIMEKIKAIGMGAAMGAGVGGAARARSIAAKNIDKQLGSAVKAKMPELAKLTPEEAMNMAMERLPVAKLRGLLEAAAFKNKAKTFAVDPNVLAAGKKSVSDFLNYEIGAGKPRGMLENLIDKVHSFGEKIPLIGSVDRGGPQAKARVIAEMLQGKNPRILNQLGISASSDPADIVAALGRLQSGAVKIKDQDMADLGATLLDYAQLNNFRKMDPNGLDIGLKTLGAGTAGTIGGGMLAGPIGALLGGAGAGAGVYRSATSGTKDKLTRFVDYLRSQGTDQKLIDDIVDRIRNGQVGPTIQSMFK